MDTNADFDPMHFNNEATEWLCTYNDCDINKDGCTYISINYPHFTKTEDSVLNKINAAIDKLVLGDEAKDAQHLCDQFIDDYEAFVNDSINLEEEYSLAWYDQREGDWISIQKRVLSFRCVISSFYGGAHPNEYVYLRNFDPQSGDSLGLGMIFDEAALEELTALGEKSFRKKYNIAKEESLDSKGYWFENNFFELTTNFAFTDQGLLFYYNSYEIAPYSMGYSEIIIPYSLIMHLFHE